MVRTKRYTEEQVIQALWDARGVRAEAAKILSCSRQTVDNYVKEYPAIMQEVEDWLTSNAIANILADLEEWG